MPRLIDANALLQSEIKRCGSIPTIGSGYTNETSFKRILDQAPTVNVVEVKHGRWQPHYEIFDADPAVGILGGNYQTGWQCSVCGRYESIQEPYCNCGAKMDGDGDG